MQKTNLREELRRVLVDNNIQATSYCLEGYQEEAVCLEISGEKYSVYEGKKEKNIILQCIKNFLMHIMILLQEYLQVKNKKKEFGRNLRSA